MPLIRTALLNVRQQILPLLGCGDKRRVDQVAVDTIRETLSNSPSRVRVRIGEGENDGMPGLFTGDELGHGSVHFDVAIDPIDGTTAVAEGGAQRWQNGQVVSAIAAASTGAIFYPSGPVRRMERIAVPWRVDGLDLDADPIENLGRIADAGGFFIRDLTVVVVSPHRNGQLLKRIRDAAISTLTPSCCVGLCTAALAQRLPRGHIVYGIGGGPETVIIAAVTRVVGGTMLARLWCVDDEERRAFERVGTDVSRVFPHDELVNARCGVAVVGITPGPIPDDALTLIEE